MCQALRLSVYELTQEQLDFMKAFRIQDELRISMKHSDPFLLVMHGGRTQLLPWGNRQSKNALPLTTHCKKESLASGKWAWLKPEKTMILASLAYSRGVWFQVRRGIEGILVTDRWGQKHVYMLTQASTHYFKIMTGSERMPALVEQIV
jgi:hypothetical protein